MSIIANPYQLLVPPEILEPIRRQLGVARWASTVDRSRGSDQQCQGNCLRRKLNRLHSQPALAGVRAEVAGVSWLLAPHPLQVRAGYNQLQTLFVTMTDRESLHARRYNSTRGAAPHAVRAWRCPLLYLQVGEFSGETSIVAVLRLKLLNLLPTLLPVHSAFLSVGVSNYSNRHCALKSEARNVESIPYEPARWLMSQTRSYLYVC